MQVEKPTSAARLFPSKRVTLALLVCFGFAVQYAQRVNLSIAIVCMVKKNISTEIESIPHLVLIDDVPKKALTKYGGQVFNEKHFPWSELEQQIILGAYWIGYVFTLIPGGWLSMTMGAKKMYAYCLLTSSIATLGIAVIYALEDTHLIFIVILRIIIGLAHGALFPATFTLWALWAVPQERGTLTSIGFCGTNVGTSAMMLVGGVLCRYVHSGWIYVFILSSCLGFIWFPLWLWQVSDSPQHHKTISKKERDYICDILGRNNLGKRRRPIPLTSLPWSRIVRSKPIIALFVTEICNLFGLFFFLSNFGKLLTEIQHVPPQNAGYILASGYMLMLIGSLVAGFIADALVKRNKITVTNVRKLFNSLTSFIPGLCMIAFYFCDESKQLLGVITTLVFLFSSGLGYGSGYIVNFADVVPAYSALIFGIATALSSLGAIIGSIVAGIWIKRPILDDWRNLFILFGVIYGIGGLVYALFASGQAHEWATLAYVKQQTSGKQEEEREESLPMQQQQEDPPVAIETA